MVNRKSPKLGLIVKGSVELKDKETKKTVYKGCTNHETDDLILFEVDKHKIKDGNGLGGRVRVDIKKTKDEAQ